MNLTKPPFKRTTTAYERQLKERGLLYFMGSDTFINDRQFHDCERCVHVSSGWGDLAKCSLDDWHYCIHHQKPYFRDRERKCDTCQIKDARQFIKFGCPMCRENGYDKYIPIKTEFKKKDPRTMPLDQCASLGDLMAHIEECKELDRQDSQTLKSHSFIKDNEFQV